MAEDLSLEAHVQRACSSFDVDWEHSRQVARLANRVFRETRHLHGLTKTARPWVEATALLHDITLSESKPSHHLTAAEIVPRLRIPVLSASAKRIIAAAVSLHPRSVRVESFLDSLAKAEQQTEMEIAGRITALLRIADGLDHSRTYATEIAAILDNGAEMEILTTGGDAAAEDTAFTNEKTDFWNALCPRPLRAVLTSENSPIDSRHLLPGDTVAEAVRRIFQQQIEQLISLQYGLSYDHDVEYVHEMRVATRRLRTALSILGKAMGDRGEKLKNELSWIAEVLGNVRDCDVFLLFLRDYMHRANKNHLPFLRKLIRRERRARRHRLLALVEAFHSERYTTFRDEFYHMAKSPIGSTEGMQCVGKRASRSVRSQARRALRQRHNRIADYGRSLQRLSPEQKHQLRIDCKKLRYTAEFFAEIYPRQLRTVTRPMARMQDLLGEVHDMEVWTQRIRQHAVRQRRPDGDTSQTGLDELLDYLDNTKGEVHRQGEDVWRKFTKPTRQRRLRKVIASPRKPAR